jgi:cellulose biosynthesis protein BcsQ
VGAECVSVSGNANLFLLPGHIGLAEYETTLGIAQELSGSLLFLRNLPGSLHYALDQTASKYQADFVLVDMSPNLGPINQNLLMTGDHFIVPLHADYSSSMGLSSLAKTLPRWKGWANTAYGIDALSNADYPFPAPRATYIGAIIRTFRSRKGEATSVFQRRIDQLTVSLKTELVPSLVDAGLLDMDLFRKKAAIEPWTPIMEVADFNSQIALSQEHQLPVFALTPEKIGQQGAVWEQTRASIDVFENAFRGCAEKVIALTA